MAVRPSLAAIIARVRIKINDPAGPSQIFSDQDIQNTLDLYRLDAFNMPLTEKWTFGTTFGVFDYLSTYTDWEDDLVLKQFLTTVVTPATSENLEGHWTFAASTLPPVFITGKTFDIFRVSADLLEQIAARWMLSYNITVDGQTLHREGVISNIMKLVRQYRLQQRAGVTEMTRKDIAAEKAPDHGGGGLTGLGAKEIDYMAKG